MTDRSSCGNWVRIRVSSATATFLAAGKRPGSSIERLLSLAAAGQVAGLLELPGDLVEGGKVARRLLAEQLANLVAIEIGETPRAFDGAERILERIESLESPDLVERRLQPEWLVSRELVALAQPIRHELVHVRSEPGEVPAESIVAQEGIHHRLELCPLLW